MRLNDKFLPLITSDCRYFIVTGGRGSAKSFTTSTFLTGLTYEAHHRILFTRYTLTAAHLSIIPEFKEKIELLNLEADFEVNQKEIINKLTKDEILFRGIKTSSGNQTANLKSLQGVSTWVNDESEELVDEKAFDTIDLSIRQKGIQNRIILILNPTTKEHWIYKRFFEEAGVAEGFNGEKNNVCYIHTTYKDNAEHLSESFIAQVERIKKTNPKKYKHQILGGWLDKADGVVFTDWEFGEFNPNNLQTSCGMDFGFSVDPDTLTEVAIDKQRKLIYLKEHIYQNSLKVNDLATLIKAKVGRKLIISEVDPRLTTDLKARGCNILPHKKGRIETGITIMQDYKLIIEPNSQNIAKELNNHVYADKGSKLYIDSFNHAIDGARYNIEYHLRDNRGVYDIR